MSGFKRATKQTSRLRLALIGPAGSGKTFTSLLLAKALGGKVAVIDTERGSASKYADLADFDVLELSESFHPARYVEAIRDAEAGGYATLIIDSLSHAWIGKDGGLDLHDKAVDRQKTKNSFTAWGEVTPHHNALVQALIGCRCHVIATMRSKTEYVLDEKNKPRKVGMAPVMRDGVEYEFDVVGDMDVDNNTLVVTKTRCPALSGQSFRKPGADFARILKQWLGDTPAGTTGDAVLNAAVLVSPRSLTATPTPAPAAPPLDSMTDLQGGVIDTLCTELGITPEQFRTQVRKDFGHASPDQMSHAQADEVITRLEKVVDNRKVPQTAG